MDRAERVLSELYKTRADDMKVFVDIQIFNSFLNGYVQGVNPQPNQCLAWFNRMVSYGVSPDANTFAILVSGFLKTADYEAASMVLQVMRTTTDIQVLDIMKSRFLTSEGVAVFRQLITKHQNNTGKSLQQLLHEVDLATNDNDVSSSPPISTISFSTLVNTVAPGVYKDIPEAKPMDAIGAKFLQKELSALQNSKKALKMIPFDLQMALEKQGYEVALQRLMHIRESSKERGDTLNALHLSPLKKTMWDWHVKMVPLIKDEIEKCANSGTRGVVEWQAYGPFLSLLPAEKLSIITILELLRLHGSSGVLDGMKLARAVIDVGKAVEMEYNATYIKQNKSLYTNGHTIQHMSSNRKDASMTVRKALSKLDQQMTASSASSSSVIIPDAFDPISSGSWNPVWPDSIRAKMGSVLTSLLIDSAKISVPSHNPETGKKITEHIPAFFHTYQYVRGKRVGIIKFSDQLIHLVSKDSLRDTLTLV
ncbi:unnamed protein product [Absidia cylindrospora]